MPQKGVGQQDPTVRVSRKLRCLSDGSEELPRGRHCPIRTGDRRIERGKPYRARIREKLGLHTRAEGDTLFELLARQADSGTKLLSQREQEVLRMLAYGHTLVEIASRLSHKS